MDYKITPQNIWIDCIAELRKTCQILFFFTSIRNSHFHSWISFELLSCKIYFDIFSSDEGKLFKSSWKEVELDQGLVGVTGELRYYSSPWLDAGRVTASVSS